MVEKREQISVKLRRKELLEKILEGNSSSNLQEWWLDNFNRTEHTYQKDITWCYKKLSLFVKDNHSELIINHLMRYDRNAENAFDALQFGASTQALQAKEKLLGLNKDNNQTFIQNNNYNLENLSDEQIDKILEQGTKHLDE